MNCQATLVIQALITGSRVRELEQRFKIVAAMTEEYLTENESKKVHY